MKKSLFILTITFLLFLLENLFAHQFQVRNININHPYIRFAISTDPAAGYMTIVNTGEESDKLIKIETQIAKHSELHVTKIYNSQATMERVNTELKVGTNIDAKLFFEQNGELEITFEVENYSEGSEHISH